MWKINPEKKIIFLEKRDVLARVKHFFGMPKYSVNNFYSYLMNEFAKVKMMQYSIPIKAEGVKNSNFRKPRYFMINEWSIADEDIKHLKKGPLTDEDGGILIVDEYSFLHKVWIWIKDNLSWVIEVIKALNRT